MIDPGVWTHQAKVGRISGAAAAAGRRNDGDGLGHLRADRERDVGERRRGGLALAVGVGESLGVEPVGVHASHPSSPEQRIRQISAPLHRQADAGSSAGQPVVRRLVA